MQNTTLSRVCCGYARRRRLAARRLACGRRGATPAGICVHTSNQLRAGGHAAAQRAQRARRARGQLRRVERQRRDRRPLGAPHREGDGRRLSCAGPGEGWTAGNGRLALQRLHCAASCSTRPPHPGKCSGAARRKETSRGPARGSQRPPARPARGLAAGWTAGCGWLARCCLHGAFTRSPRPRQPRRPLLRFRSRF